MEKGKKLRNLISKLGLENNIKLFQYSENIYSIYLILEASYYLHYGKILVLS